MRWLLLALLCFGCKHHAPAGAGSGSGSAAPVEPWEIERMTDDTIIVGRGSAVAVIDVAGRVVSHPAISPDFAKDAPMGKGVIVSTDGANEDEFHVIDLTTGKERWHATAAHRSPSMVFGNTSIGVLTVEGVELHHLVDGALGYHRTGPEVVDSIYRDGAFVFIDDTGLVEAVDEAHDARRWTFDTKAGHLDPQKRYLRSEPGVVHVLGTDLDLATGKERSTSPAQPKRKHLDDTQSVIAATNQHTRLVSAGYPQRKAYLLDDDDGIIWASSEWSDVLSRFPSLDPRGLAITNADSGVVLLQPLGNETRVLVGFDDKTGHVRFTRDLANDDELIGAIDDCIGFAVGGKAAKLQCLDEKTGAVRWEHAGAGMRVWRNGTHWITVSGTPATLEALDNTGKTLWTTQLPDTTGVDWPIAHHGSDNEVAWDRGPTYFVLAEPRTITIVSVETGKLVTVTP